jgi:hypothetical protein
MRSPKQSGARHGRWYSYYAGYSSGFVEDAIDLLAPGPDGLVLDPWNGSGTTTTVCQSRGIPSTGFDINPALVVVARSRLLGPDVAPSIAPLAADLLEHARDAEIAIAECDPLRDWFEEESVRTIRGLCAAILQVLGPHSPEPNPLEGDLPPLAAFFYVGLFHAVRAALSSCATSNPTWIRSPGADKVLVSRDIVLRGFLDRCLELRDKLHAQPRALSAATVGLANSTRIPLKDATVTGAITSPPYCTRIDYVVATRPELAVLGVTKERARSLRDQMVGTPTITGIGTSADPAWGTQANDLLELVAKHQSRASSTYYLAYFLQYFDSMCQSLHEISRALRNGSSAVLVVQDSYYKDVHIDLARIISEMGRETGLATVSRTDFAASSTMAAVNPRSRVWRSSFAATESVLHLMREA